MPAPAPTAAIDVVDESNEPIGTAQRREVLPEGLNFRTVHVLVTDEDGELLLQRLGPRNDRHPHLWGSSVAGYLWAGENYAAGARRRLAEELGVEGDPEFIGVTPMRDERSIKFIGVFHASVARAAPHIQDPGHIEALNWLAPTELIEALRLEPEVFTASLAHVVNFAMSDGRFTFG